MNFLCDYIRSHDEFTKPVAFKLHMDGIRQSCFGGCVSMIISLYMTYIIVWKSYEMIVKNDPYTGTHVIGYTEKDAEIPLAGMAKPMFTIM